LRLSFGVCRQQLARTRDFNCPPRGRRRSRQGVTIEALAASIKKYLQLFQQKKNFIIFAVS